MNVTKATRERASSTGSIKKYLNKRKRGKEENQEEGNTQLKKEAKIMSNTNNIEKLLASINTQLTEIKSELKDTKNDFREEIRMLKEDLLNRETDWQKEKE